MSARTTYLIFLLIVLSSFTKAQVPNYFSNNPEWRVSHQLDSGYPCVEYTDYVVYLDGDSTIVPNLYKKVYKRGITYYSWFGTDQSGNPNFTCYGSDTFNLFIGLVRQDSMSIYHWDGVADTLLMDFNLSIGDTINNWTLGNSTGWIVTSTDSVQINSIYHSVFYANMGTPDSTIIIEGIGTGAGLLERMPTYFEDDSYLMCYSQNGNTEWINNMVIGPCNFDVGINTLESISVNVYPNPSSTFFNVRVEGNENCPYTIYSLEGKCVHQGRLNTIDRFGEDLESGMYLIQIATKSGKATSRIIKY